jgi:hypothetical protein
VENIAFFNTRLGLYLLEKYKVPFPDGSYVTTPVYIKNINH